MNKPTFILALIAFFILAGTRASAQVVTVEAKIDSLQILIGEQARIQLQVAMNNEQQAVFPQFIDTLVHGIEVLEASKIDTQYVNNKQRVLLTREYTITSFDSALYYIPPIPVQVDNVEYLSKALALKVYSVPVDTLNPDVFFQHKDIMKAPFAWADWWLVIVLCVLFVPFVLLLIYLSKRLRDNKPIIRKVKVEPKLPPHVLAMQHIEKVKEEKAWQKGELKEYYTELTDSIRLYIKDRFGFNALEMTSSEIIDKLLEIKNKDEIKALKELFMTSDLVKFAKHNPMINENDANLINAIDFINQTKEEEDENAKPQPTEITIVEKRSLRTKIILIAAVTLLSVSIVASVIYVITQLIDLR